MSKQQRLPHELDPFRLVEARACLQGSVPLRQFRRTKSLLADEEGTIRVELQFDEDELGIPVMEGTLQADLQLCCQRCLEAFHFPLKVDIALAWVRRESDMGSLPIRYEPYLVHQTPIVLNDVLEDELILALPNVPMHDIEECPASHLVGTGEPSVSNDTEENSEKGDNPFSVLGSLKDPER